MAGLLDILGKEVTPTSTFWFADLAVEEMASY